MLQNLKDRILKLKFYLRLVLSFLLCLHFVVELNMI